MNHTISFTPQLLYLASELNVLAIHCRAKKAKKKIEITFQVEFESHTAFVLLGKQQKKPFLVFYLSACLCAFWPPVWVATLITAQLCSIIPLRARGADWIRAPRHLWLRRQQRVCVPSVSAAATLNVAAPSSLGRTTTLNRAASGGWRVVVVPWHLPLVSIRAGAALGREQESQRRVSPRRGMGHVCYHR